MLLNCNQILKLRLSIDLSQIVTANNAHLLCGTSSSCTGILPILRLIDPRQQEEMSVVVASMLMCSWKCFDTIGLLISCCTRYVHLILFHLQFLETFVTYPSPGLSVPSYTYSGAIQAWRRKLQALTLGRFPKGCLSTACCPSTLEIFNGKNIES